MVSQTNWRDYQPISVVVRCSGIRSHYLDIYFSVSINQIYKIAVNHKSGFLFLKIEMLMFSAYTSCLFIPVRTSSLISRSTFLGMFVFKI